MGGRQLQRQQWPLRHGAREPARPFTAGQATRPLVGCLEVAAVGRRPAHPQRKRQPPALPQRQQGEGVWQPPRAPMPWCCSPSGSNSGSSIGPPWRRCSRRGSSWRRWATGVGCGGGRGVKLAVWRCPPGRGLIRGADARRRRLPGKPAKTPTTRQAVQVYCDVISAGAGSLR